MAQKPSRRLAREWAVQMLTAYDINPAEDLDRFIEDEWILLMSPECKSFDQKTRAVSPLKKFAEERVRGVIDKLSEIDGVLEGLLADDWPLQRLGTVERAVLRMGIWEIAYSNVPPPVVVNEAVDLTNWFSTPKSRSLVNGILDRYAKSRR